MRIGIIGGGQLGMMMAEEGILSGHSFVSLDSNPKCPLSYLSSTHISAAYDDQVALERLYTLCDVITYEFENVDFNLVSRFENKIPQKSKALYVSKNRLREKSFVRGLNIPVPEFYRYDGVIYETPSVAKTTEGGYDGKGQFHIKTTDELASIELPEKEELIIEEFVAYDYEISVVLTRDEYDNIYTYPITRNIHKDGILYKSSTYLPVNDVAMDKAVKYSKTIIKSLDYIGTLAIEYFVKEDKPIFNEYAPRPHNSGHYTIEGTTTSQFMNHVLAITGEQIEEPRLVNHAEMINVLGQDMAFVDRAKKVKEASIHLYNKDKVLSNRKMGHITVTHENIAELKSLSDYITQEQS